MFYSVTSAVVFLFFNLAQAQYNQWNPYNQYYNPVPQYNPTPQYTFQGGVFNSNWAANLAKQIQQFASTLIPSLGNSVFVATKDGVTTVIATISGRLHTAKFPYGTSISTFTSIHTDSQGQLVEEFTIKVNGKSYTYKTISGRTTGPPGGGPFQIN